MPSPCFNLLADQWIPVVARSGRVFRISPAEITGDVLSNPIQDIAWPRPDFRAAQLEFLIGLLTTACQPQDEEAWERWWHAPPAPEELAERFAPFAAAFDLDGHGARFLQDQEDLGGEAVPVAGLLIEQPGANTEKNNADLFVKRGRVDVLARSAAAVALYALQAFAPSGGAGHRTSLRGGGPLTTLAVPPPGRATLWHLLWLNVAPVFKERDDGGPQERLGEVFPWLAPTRVSDKAGVATTGEDIHPAQCFWGMPRRIRLEFAPNVDRLPCAVTGEIDEVVVRSYRTRPYGVNYTAVPHPLTPVYRVKAGAEWLPVHPQPGGIAYRHWLSYVLPDDGAAPTRAPAACVTRAEQRLAALREGGARLRLLGYDMDNMKARGFVEAEMPLLFASDAATGEGGGPRQRAFEVLTRRLVNGAAETAGLVLSAIRTARGGDRGAALDLVRESFFRETEQAFFATVHEGLDAIETEPDAALQPIADRWLTGTLRPAALGMFDREVPVGAIVAGADVAAIGKMVQARRLLSVALAGHGSAGKRLFDALGMGAPQPKAKKKAGAGEEVGA